LTVYITAVSMTAGNRAEHIDSVRWLNPTDGKTGQSTREAMVDWIDNNNGIAKVGSSTGPVAVETVHPAGRPAYIRTVANGQETDNLLSLARY